MFVKIADFGLSSNEPDRTLVVNTVKGGIHRMLT